MDKLPLARLALLALLPVHPWRMGLGTITLLAPLPTQLPPKCSAAPRGLPGHKAAGWDTLTHPQDVHPVVIGTKIHAELDQELAHLQGRDILMAH